MLKIKLKNDMVIAMKSGDRGCVDTIRYLISLIEKKELAVLKNELSEDEEVSVLRKERKDKEESMKIFGDAGRDDLVEKLKKEIVVLDEYLPAMASRDDILAYAREVVEKKGPNFGQVMGEVMKKFGSSVDGSQVSVIVKEILG